jgi:hypothetical protein
MTQDEIIKMARRVAGMITIHANGEATYSFYENQLRAFAKLVAEREREACAKLFEQGDEMGEWYSYEVAKEIRARGQA